MGQLVPFFAIPSPDLVLNLFASGAQVLGLLAVTLGGAAVKRGGGAKGKAKASSPWPFRVVLMLFIASSAGFLLYHLDAVDSEKRRLSRNLYRPSKEAGKSVGDTSLKTLSLSKQFTHPRAISTERLAEWKEEGRGLNIVDVREPEEVERGRIQGSWHVRYPDLKETGKGLEVEGQTTILICFSGNRSSELTDTFTERGMELYFLIGGYEKWIAEEREMKIPDDVARGELRDLATYPNKDVLLSTEEMLVLHDEGDVTVIDVRYPKDFERSHIAGAINLPLRAMPTEEMWSRLRGLPADRRYVVACYDKRSSFYGAILGLRLHRVDREFVGRYTEPRSFFLPPSAKSYVAAWQKENETTLLSVVAKPLRGALRFLNDSVGHFGLAVVLLVLGLRFLLLPFSLKSDRDQQVMRSLKPRVDELRERYRDAPRRWSRATKKLYKEAGLRPGLNLIGTVVQLVVFVVFFTVVDDLSKGVEDSFLWVPALGLADPYIILPLIVGGIFFSFMAYSAQKRTPGRYVMWVAVAGGLFLLLKGLAAALNLYLSVNVGILLLQAVLLRAWMGRTKKAKGVVETAPELESEGVIPLARAHQLEGCGGKATRLGELMSMGVPVPNGFVLSDDLLFGQGRRPEGSNQSEADLLPSSARTAIDEAWRYISVPEVAVRSSGLKEDGADKSYAGVFESVLNVSRSKLPEALDFVVGSLRSGRAAAYSGDEGERGAVVIQEMVDASYAGVLFTEHPSDSGSCFVEMVEGLGEELVSGRVTPKGFRYGRRSGELMQDEKPAIDLAPLLEMGRCIEAGFGRPQDIEWVWAKDGFRIVQARDITTLARRGEGRRARMEAERHRLVELLAPAGGEGRLGQNELAELLPRPTPLSFGIMEAIWGPGGTAELACDRLGIAYEADEEAPYIVSVFGALYVNRAEEKRRLAGGLGTLASFRLARSADAIGDVYQEVYLPEYSADVRLLEAIDLGRLDQQELGGLFRDWMKRFVEDVYVEAEVVNIVADFCTKTARAELEKRNLDAASGIGPPPETVVSRAMSRLARGDREGFLSAFSHRAPLDFELSQPRYFEAEEKVTQLLERARRAGAGSHEAGGAELPEDKVLRLSVARARRFQALKEEAKHSSLRLLALLRAVVVEVDRRHGAEGQLFQLSPDEFTRFCTAEPAAADELLALARTRRRAAAEFLEIELDTEINLAQLEVLPLDGSRVQAQVPKGELSGARVSGEGIVEGYARVLRSSEEADLFSKGEILVARFTDPSWAPLFPLAGGIITEVGGWLSHAAILAREYDLAAIVGARGAMAAIEDGDIIRLHPDGRIERVSGAAGAQGEATAEA